MATLCLAALLPSCVSFQPYEGDGAPIGEKTVRVTQTSGERIVLESPWVDENGEFAGSVHGNGAQRWVQWWVRIPMDSIAGFEVLPQPDGPTRVVLTILSTPQADPVVADLLTCLVVAVAPFTRGC
jgi:hypothetical protein